MKNILLEYYDIGADWLRADLSAYLRPGMRAAVIAFSFRDSQVRSHADWLSLYGPGGKYHEGIRAGLAAYGVEGEAVSFVDYYADTPQTAREKLARADIVYLPGGLPDRMMDRIREFGLEEPLRRFDGVVMGYSAGAMIQLGEYHISPDEDYPRFIYRQGLGLLDGFYLEPHYEGNPVQDDAIRCVLTERRRPVFATEFGRGAIIVDNGERRLIGSVRTFLPA